MTHLGILADDLTGASDTGVQFSRLGGRVLVLVSLEHLPARIAGEWDVLVVNSDTRNAAPSEARCRVETALAFLARAGWPLLYKKVDSTLRGNLGPELEEVMARGVARAYVAPAFPLAGRTVEDGLLKVLGKPVHETEMGKDGLAPVASSRVAALMGPTLEAAAAHLAVEAIGQGAQAVARFLDGLPGDRRVIICDAVEQAHLAVLAEAILPRISGAVIVGSAGMARELAARLLAGRNPPAPPQAARTGPLLVVAGSRSEVTRAQTAQLATRSDVAHLVVEPRWVEGDDEEARRAALVRSATAAGTAPGGAATILITIAPGGAEDGPAAFRDRSARLCRFLGRVIAALAGGVGLRGLVLTGGDIAAAGLAALGAHGIRLGSEVLPGIPLGWLVGGSEDGLPLVTKAGGFGGPDALCRAVLSLAP